MIIRQEAIQLAIDYLDKKEVTTDGTYNSIRDIFLSEVMKEKIEGLDTKDKILEVLKKGSRSNQQGVKELRESLDIRASFSLSNMSAFAETVHIGKDDSARKDYECFFTDGLWQNQLRKKLRQDHGVLGRDLTFVISHQSSEINRGIVEHVSNAIDFCDGFSVEVEIIQSQNDTATGYSVFDAGKGMNPQDLIEKLMIPLMSGARAADTASIGKFGVGFMTGFALLKDDGDILQVQTVSEEKGYKLLFEKKGDQILVVPGVQNEISHGTKVTVQTKNFDTDNAERLLKRHISKNTRTEVHLQKEGNREHINDTSNDIVVEITRGKKSRSALVCTPDTNEEMKETKCQGQILINGVMVEEIEFSGVNVPCFFAIDLPYDTPLPESRNKVIYDDNSIKSVELLFEELFQFETDEKIKLQMINALAEIVNILQQRKSKISSEQDILMKLGKKINQMYPGKCFISNKKDFLDLATEDGIYVSEKIYEVTTVPEGAQVMTNFVSDTHTLYIIDFKDNPEKSVIIMDDVILMDRKAYEQQKDCPVLLNIFINEGRKEVGHLKGGKVGHELKFESLIGEETFAEILEGRTKGFSVFVEQVLCRHLAKVGKSCRVTEKFNFTKYLSQFITGEITEIDQEVFNSLLEKDILYEREFGRKKIFREAKHLKECFKGEELGEMIEEYHQEIDTSVEQKVDFFSSLKIGKDFSVEQLQFFLGIGAIFASSVRDIYSLVNIVTFSESSNLGYKDYFVALEENIKSMMREYPHEFGNQLFSLGENEVSGLDFLNQFVELYSEIRRKDYGRGLLEKSEEFGSIFRELGFDLVRFIEKIKILHKYEKFKEENPEDVDIVSKYISLHRCFGDTQGNELFEGYFQLAKTHKQFMESFYNNIIQTVSSNPAIGMQELRALFLLGFHPMAGFITSSGDSFEFQEVLGESRIADERTFEDSEQYEGYNYSRLQRYPYYKKGIGLDFKALIHKPEQDFYDVLNTSSKDLEFLLPILGKNLSSIFSIPIVKDFFEKFSGMITSELVKKGSGHEAYSLVRFDEILRDFSGFSEELSQNKLDTLSKFLQENYDIGRMGLTSVKEFIMLIKRVLEGGGLPDDEFEFALDIYTQRTNFEISEDNSSPRHGFSQQVIKILYKYFSDISGEDISGFIDFWLNIAEARVGEEGKILDNSSIHSGNDGLDVEMISTEEKLIRACQIWEELLSVPVSNRKELVKMFSQSARAQGSGRDHSYGFFLFSKELHEIPELIRPYVIHFMTGERDLSSNDSLQRSVQVQLEKYQHSILLTCLTLASKLEHGEFAKQLSDPSKFEKWIGEQSHHKDMLLLQRGLFHAIVHQSSSDPFLFLREMIQNSYDAVKDTEIEGGNKSMKIDEFLEDDSYVLQMQDSIGMDFDTVMGYLLVPERSTKGSENLGKFGIGFLSIFKDAKKVVIKTKKDGVPVCISASPVFDSQGNIQDMEIEYSLLQGDTDFQGTVIQKYMNRSEKVLQSSFVQDAVARYGESVDSHVMPLMFNDQQVNSPVKILTSYKTQYGDIEVLSGKTVRIKQGGLDVMPFPNELLEVVPEKIRDLILQQGLIINLPKSIPLTRSRNDIAGRQEYFPLLKEITFVIAIESFVRKFADGDVDFDMLPFDFFNSVFSTPSKGTLSHLLQLADLHLSGILLDSQEINAGNWNVNWEKYNDKFMLLDLLVNVKVIEYEGEKFSLREIADNIFDGKNFDENKLPSALSLHIKKAIVHHTFAKNLQREKEDKSEIDISDIDIGEFSCEVYQKIEKDADTYLAFIELNRVLGSKLIDSDVSNMLYFSSEPSIAHATCSRSLKSWNLKSKEVQYLLELLSSFLQTGYWGSKQREKFWKSFLKTSTHEDAHLHEKSDHWGAVHSEHFYDRQREIVNDMIYGVDIGKIEQELKQKFKGTLVDSRNFLEMCGVEYRQS